jgi:hypothetical protein
MSNNWEFHFRNANGGFSNNSNYFAVNHIPCETQSIVYKGIDRGNCWNHLVPPNVTGGDDSVYCPSTAVVDFSNWVDVICEALKEAADIALFIATEGTDAEAFLGICDGVYGLVQGTAAAKIKDHGVTAAQFQSYLTENPQTAASAVGLTVTEVTSFAAGMGLGTAWAFAAGDHYQQQIFEDNSMNNNAGFTVARGDPNAYPYAGADYLANAAWVQNGHLIYYWDGWLLPGPNNNDWGGTSSLWIPYTGP